MARIAGTTDNNPTITAATIGATSAQALAANKTRRALIVSNPSSAATVSLQIQPLSGAAVAAVLNGAGTITLAPGQTITLDSILVQAAIYAIASAGSTPFTFLEWN